MGHIQQVERVVESLDSRRRGRQRNVHGVLFEEIHRFRIPGQIPHRHLQQLSLLSREYRVGGERIGS